MTRRQSFGCLMIAAVSAVFAAVSLITGIVCIAREGLWNCAALVTIIPGGLLVIAFGAGLTALRSSGSPDDPGDFGFTRIEGGRSVDDDER
jgi:hypothetical protein